MDNQFSRTALLFGDAAIQKLHRSRVAVFGVGGVGGYAVEALARSGVGAIDVVDNDTVSPTNLNRQIIALHSTVGRLKTDVICERVRDINPACTVTPHPLFFTDETQNEIDLTQFDYVVDAVDSVKAKLLLATLCSEKNIPLIACMGTGNKLNPMGFEVADIADTSYDPLARVMRKELQQRGIRHLTVVYSKEQAQKIDEEKIKALLQAEQSPKRTLPASNAFVPAAAGLLIASKVIEDLTKRI